MSDDESPDNAKSPIQSIVVSANRTKALIASLLATALMFVSDITSATGIPKAVSHDLTGAFSPISLR
jgi:hypothetical protein